MILSPEQIELAKALCKLESGANFEFLVMVECIKNPDLLVVFAHGISKICFRGFINDNVRIGNAGTVYIRNDRELLVPSNGFTSLAKKTRRSLVQVNAEFGIFGDDMVSRWYLSANVVGAPFTIKGDYSVLTNGLVFDKNTWRQNGNSSRNSN